jgi:hypothetical protein
MRSQPYSRLTAIRKFNASCLKGATDGFHVVSQPCDRAIGRFHSAQRRHRNVCGLGKFWLTHSRQDAGSCDLPADDMISFHHFDRKQLIRDSI